MNRPNDTLERARQFLAVSTWEPDLVYQEAKDIYLKMNRRWMADFTSGPGVANVGWCREEITGPVCDAIGKYGVFGGNECSNTSQIALAEKLCQISPGNFPKKVFFSNSGGEAVEAAVVACLLSRPERQGMLSFVKNFDGRMGLGRSATSSREVLIKNIPRAISKSNYLIFPSEYPESDAQKRLMESLSTPTKYLDYMMCQLGAFIGEINFVLIELVQGEGGMNVAHKEIMPAVVKELRRNGVRIIIDEVQTGIGRTGKMFACEHYGIEPDILVLAKALSGGAYPIGATIMSDEVSFKFERQHSNTWGGSAPACVAGLKTIELIEKEELLENCCNMGRQMKFLLRSAVQKNEKLGVLVSDVNGLNLMSRISFQSPRADISAKDVRDRVRAKALENGLFMMGCGERSLRLMPPLTITEDELLKSMISLEKSIEKVYDDLFK